ncbi:uncharacterized protein B0T15DRAFT_533719 [Chaetomium strumarium]|uniref:SET domain-containing protein n=1 Tax=Chaetomium strumarium TaxID=1170767 RepID=A0AAJ0GTQ0_9PEZI|nr:hypothetical protein B0T15DRAFT_533719 [Chaetomium strumarium]
MKESDQSRFDALVEWSRRHSGSLHPSLEIYHDDVTKFSLRVKPSVGGGLTAPHKAVTCPVSTTLSYLNALVDGPLNVASPLKQQDAAFPERFMQSCPPHVIGRFFLIKEYLKGKDSFWWPYIATLPQPEHVKDWALPAFWPEADIANLEGTNARVAIEEIQENVSQEFRHARRALKHGDYRGWQDYHQILYKWAFCIFTSRSFRPSLVLSESAKQHVSGLLPEGSQLDDFSILQPVFDIANHSMTARYTWDVTSDPSCCQLICGDSYKPGDQVYNNYGLKTNSELLLGYGFILPETEELHNDYVHVRKRQQHQDGGDGGGDAPKPQDFLISLRPINHPSSLVGRSRPSSSSSFPSRLSTLPGFAHFEPALVDDLTSALATPEETRLLQRWNDKALLSSSTTDPADSAAAPPPPPELAGLVGRVKGMLAGKLQYDYQRLVVAVQEEGEEEESDEEVEREARPPAASRNQMLAFEYRGRCKNVLLAAMRDLNVAPFVLGEE